MTAKDITQFLLTMLISPVLIACWLFLGNEGWYNLYAAWVIIGVILMFFTLGMVILASALDYSWRTEEVRRKALPKRPLQFLSWAINFVIFLILMWHGKFFIGTGLLLTMFGSIILVCMLSFPVDGEKPDGLQTGY